MRTPTRNCLLVGLCLLSLTTVGVAESISISIDARDLPRKLLSSTVTIPIDRQLVKDNQLALWYPKWVPGSHGPGGPIQNVAGLKFLDGNGQVLEWERAKGEVYRVEVQLPPEAKTLEIQVRYITDQPSTTSVGHDSFGSALLGFVSAGTVLLYPEGWNIDEIRVDANLILPPDWVAASALKQSAGEDGGITFQPASLRAFVDSPIMCGRYHRKYDLTEEKGTPPHRLHVFSEAESVLELPAEMLQRMKDMVTQSARLFGSHPFEEFDILLATSDLLGRNGLEHSSSTFNVLGQRSFQEPDKLKGWDRLLVPHEYIHAWCGKYRRPAGMATTDFHTDKSTELLWVYEGLTQYLGELIEARSGIMSADEFRNRLAVEIRAAQLQQGRDWRTLADTGACSHILRAGSSYWPRLRRSQDYYMEGMLFWLEADALIRTETGGSKSLDDFCQSFFAHSNGDPHPNGFTREDIVTALNTVHEFDWDGLIRRRIEMPVERFDPAVVNLLGYTIQYSNEKPDIPANTFRHVGGVDAWDSLGGVIDNNGTIQDLLLESPLHTANLGPGMKIMGVNGHKFSANRMRDAIALSATTGEIKVMVASGDSFQDHIVKYDGGPRFMVLRRNDSQPDALAEILKPR